MQENPELASKQIMAMNDDMTEISECDLDIIHITENKEFDLETGEYIVIRYD